MQRRAIYFLTFALLFLGANFYIAHIASQTKPFTMEQIRRALAAIKEKRITEIKVIRDIRSNKVDFPLTKENEKLLRDEGASDELIEAIRQNSPLLSTPKIKIEEIKNSIGMEFVKIPPGFFMMGSDKYDNEKPIHKVTINYEFYMGKYEVTIGEWKKIMGDLPETDLPKFTESDNQPIVVVSWNDAKEFIRKLNAKNDGYEYRLPSEAEWEYTARAGTKTEFAFGVSLSSNDANFGGNYPSGYAAKGKLEKTVEVGSYRPNAWGLYDMHGNVSEWIEDIYNENGYSGLPTNGSANLSIGNASMRVLRGGAYYSLDINCRSAVRDTFELATRSHGVGFRVVARAKVSQNEKSQPTTSNTTSGNNTVGTIIKNSIGMEFALIPAGSFMMGSVKGRDDEKPVHKVTINYEFYMGKYEVTIGEWKKVMGDITEELKSGDAKFRESDYQPIIYVSWDDAQEFIKKLNVKSDGYEYRLPSEAEWEYAARAGTVTEFAFGDGLSLQQANFAGGDNSKEKSLGKTVEVGSYKPNGWGLYDMHGNVLEWVEDNDSRIEGYQKSPTDGSANLNVGFSNLRMVRGGSWLSDSLACRSAYRVGAVFSLRDYHFGFRLVARRAR